MADPQPDDPTLPAPPSPLRRVGIPVVLAALGLAATGWVFWLAFGSQREDVATSRAFLTHIAEARYPEAVALLSPDVAAQVNSVQLSRMFGEIEPWAHIGFHSRSTQSNGSGRTTELTGTGDTISGCESGLSIRLHNGRIEMFQIQPLCLRADTEA